MIQEGLDLLFGRFHAAGEIAVADPVWCRRLYLALLHEVHELPADSPVLTATEDTAADDISIRVQLLVTTLVAAPQYPLWQGLPADSTLTPADVHARLQECTGIDSGPADRTAQQQRNLDEILAVTRMPERSLDTNLLYATFLFQDIVSKRLDGRNPFSNQGVWCDGSHDDRALNAGVARFSADPTALRDHSYDSDLTGQVSLPVLTLHAIGDPQVVVEHEAAYRATLRGAGRDGNLVQTFTTESEHGELSNAEYANSIAALDTWARSGRKPTPGSVARTCGRFDDTYRSGCFYAPEFSPAPYGTTIRLRPGTHHWPAMSAAQERAWSRIDVVGIAP